MQGVSFEKCLFWREWRGHADDSSYLPSLLYVLLFWHLGTATVTCFGVTILDACVSRCWRYFTAVPWVFEFKWLSCWHETSIWNFSLGAVIFNLNQNSTVVCSKQEVFLTDFSSHISFFLVKVCFFPSPSLGPLLWNVTLYVWWGSMICAMLMDIQANWCFSLS